MSWIFFFFIIRFGVLFLRRGWNSCTRQLTRLWRLERSGSWEACSIGVLCTRRLWCWGCVPFCRRLLERWDHRGCRARILGQRWYRGGLPRWRVSLFFSSEPAWIWGLVGRMNSNLFYYPEWRTGAVLPLWETRRRRLLYFQLKTRRQFSGRYCARPELFRHLERRDIYESDKGSIKVGNGKYSLIYRKWIFSIFW